MRIPLNAVFFSVIARNEVTRQSKLESAPRSVHYAFAPWISQAVCAFRFWRNLAKRAVKIIGRYTNAIFANFTASGNTFSACTKCFAQGRIPVRDAPQKTKKSPQFRGDFSVARKKTEGIRTAKIPSLAAYKQA